MQPRERYAGKFGLALDKIFFQTLAALKSCNWILHLWFPHIKSSTFSVQSLLLTNSKGESVSSDRIPDQGLVGPWGLTWSTARVKMLYGSNSHFFFILCLVNSFYFTVEFLHFLTLSQSEFVVMDDQSKDSEHGRLRLDPMVKLYTWSSFVQLRKEFNRSHCWITCHPSGHRDEDWPTKIVANPYQKAFSCGEASSQSYKCNSSVVTFISGSRWLVWDLSLILQLAFNRPITYN